MTERDLVVSLQAAIARADPTWVNQPSHLRRRLEEELGPDARGLRSQVHQLVVAAEERIPIRLKRNGWSPTERDELARLLVATRGWTPGASDWAVVTWAAALGLTDERPARPTATPPRPEQSPNPLPSPIPEPKARNPRASAALPAETDLPSEYLAGATELPSDSLSAATQLPDVVRHVPPPRPPRPPAVAVEPEHVRATSPRKLPRGGTRGTTRKAAKFLDQPLDVAYVVKAGASPALLLLALPIGIAGFVAPALSGILLMTFTLIMVFGTAFWPARILAVKGDEVWLLSKKLGLSMKPKAVIHQANRGEIVYAGGWPFPSVRIAGQRLWFQFPVTGAARRLPQTASTSAVEALQ